jgi:hypothetical protein
VEGDWVTLTEEVKGYDDLAALMRSVTDLLPPQLSARTPEPRYTHLWDAVRELFDGATLTPARVVTAFLQADHRGAR